MPAIVTIANELYGHHGQAGNVQPGLGQNEAAWRQELEEVSVKPVTLEHALSTIQQHTLVGQRKDAVKKWQAERDRYQDDKRQGPPLHPGNRHSKSG